MLDAVHSTMNKTDTVPPSSVELRVLNKEDKHSTNKCANKYLINAVEMKGRGEKAQGAMRGVRGVRGNLVQIRR